MTAARGPHPNPDIQLAAAPPPTIDRPAAGQSASPARGVLVVLVGAAVAIAASELVGVASSLTVAVALGAVTGNVGLIRAETEPGLRLAGSLFLRAGVVLFGLRLVLPDALSLGPRALAVVVAVVLVTFFGTQLLARRMGVSEGLGLLVATGFSICGASAVAAMDGVIDADEEDVTYAIAMVTLCGTLAILVLPLVADWSGMDAAQFGAWTGASVHDVGQVVATASGGGAVAMGVAITVKLARVVLLAPIVIWSGRRHRRNRASLGPTGLDVHVADAVGRPPRWPLRHVGGRRRSRIPPIVPLFVIGFLAAAVLRSSGVVPDDVLRLAGWLERVLLAAAMVALGHGVKVHRLRSLGIRPVALALISWGLIAVSSYVAVLSLGVGTTS